MRRSKIFYRRNLFSIGLLVSLLMHLITGLFLWRLHLTGEKEVRLWVELLSPPPSPERRSEHGWSEQGTEGGRGGVRLWRSRLGGEGGPLLRAAPSVEQGVSEIGSPGTTEGPPGSGIGSAGPGGGMGRTAAGAGGLGAPGEGLANLPMPTDTLQSLEAIKMEMFHRWVEERERYKALVLYDADTTSARRRNHALSRQIVMEAVAAMGGQEALIQLRAIDYEGHFHRAYGPKSEYAQNLPGGARLVYDGKQGWVDVWGSVYPLKGQGLQEIQRRVERWDFLSRYLGDGVQLSYGGTWTGRLDMLAPTKEDYHVIRVDDQKFGGAFLAFFDMKTHLLAAEETPPERPQRRDLFGDYGKVGSAYIYQKVEHLLLGVVQYIRPTSPVHYNAPANEEMFTVLPNAPVRNLPTTGAGIIAVSQDIPAKTAPAISKTEGTLWVDVQIPNDASGMPVLPGSLSQLNATQREIVRKQVEETVIEEMSQRGLFRQVAPLKDIWMHQGLRSGDYILKIPLFAGGIYQAQFFEGSSMQQMVQDGPPDETYYHDNDGWYFDPETGQYIFPECPFYNLRSFIIEDNIAYIDRRKLLELISRTYVKMEQTLGWYRHGERSHLPYLDSCCYCQKP